MFFKLSSTLLWTQFLESLYHKFILIIGFSFTMANDPNRDVLPVKEDCCCKTVKGSNEKVDHQILGKLSRCELEDRFLRLLDDQTQLKKLVNCQEEKIKRLGTKLLRLINEKKNGRKLLDQQPKEAEDLHLRIIELEHENYALKDKNIVLKQQLANHSRSITIHPSPVRSNHTSPLMSMRQVPPPIQTETAYDIGNKNNVQEVQLQEAEAHIKELNEEIKSLHCKINFLEENLERNNLDSRKIKVTENIELIRLQRSLKQQAIQISTLQEKIKNYEHNQKLLKEELSKAHIENEKALCLISEKQNNILDLCSKLEEKNLNRLEEDEMKQRINDLMMERDSLKERSDHLMKTISVKAEEAEHIDELKKTLAEEKIKKGQLEEALIATQNLLCTLKHSCKENCCKNTKDMDVPTNMKLSEKQEKTCLLEKSSAFESGEKPDQSQIETGTKDALESRIIKCLSPLPENAKISFLGPDYENKALLSDIAKDKTEIENLSDPTEIEKGMYDPEKIKLEREVEYLREMLRNQTSRCETQQSEITRLMYELKINEDKCNDTLRKLDLHLKIFQNLEMRNQQNERNSSQAESLQKTSSTVLPVASKIENQEKPSREKFKMGVGSIKASEENIYERLGSVDKSYDGGIEKEKSLKITEPELKKRFVNQVFLESSDEENGDERTFERESFIKKLDELDEGNIGLETKKKTFYAGEVRLRHGSWSNSPSKTTFNHTKRYSSASESSRTPSDSNFQVQKKNNVREDKKEGQVSKRKPFLKAAQDTDVPKDDQEVTITILWLQLQEGSSLWINDSISLIFVDFSFLDVKGEEAETPESLTKPKNPEEKCIFNFAKTIKMTESRKKLLKSLLSKPDFELVVFKVVSDSDEINDNYISEDVGVAVITVKQFYEFCSNGPHNIIVRDTKDAREVLGLLSVSVDASPGLIITEN